MIDQLPRPDIQIDDTAITWRQFPGYDGLYFWVLGVNEERQQVDIYFRLAPGARCPGHRHVGAPDTLVVEGVQPPPVVITVHRAGEVAQPQARLCPPKVIL